MRTPAEREAFEARCALVQQWPVGTRVRIGRRSVVVYPNGTIAPAPAWFDEGVNMHEGKVGVVHGHDGVHHLVGIVGGAGRYAFCDLELEVR